MATRPFPMLVFIMFATLLQAARGESTTDPFSWLNLGGLQQLVNERDAQDASVAEFCWKDSYGRGVGTIPTNCAPGYVRIGLICYKECPSGMERKGVDCHSICPTSMSDQGLYCRKTEYGRGAGYPWLFGDFFNSDGMFRRCQADHGSGKCEMHGVVVYPKCRPGFHPAGCCICRPNAPDCAALGLGHRLDLSCAKHIQVGQIGPALCDAGKQYDTGLCYTLCKKGFYGVGPVCWSNAPSGWQGCGMGAAVDSAKCAEVIVGQVEAVGQLALNIVTLGGGSAISSVAKVGKVAKLTKMKSMFSKLQKGYKSIKKTYRERLIKGAKRLKQGKEAYLVDHEVFEEPKKASPLDIVRTSMEIAAIADPTGITGAIAAYAYPVCSAIFGEDYGISGSTSQTVPASTFENCVYHQIGFQHECTGEETFQGRMTIQECEAACDTAGAQCEAIEFGTAPNTCGGGKCDCYTIPKCSSLASHPSFGAFKRECDDDCGYRKVATSQACTGTETNHGKMTRKQCEDKCDALGLSCEAIDFGKGSKCSGTSCECLTVPRCSGFKSTSAYDVWKHSCDRSQCPYRRVATGQECMRTGRESNFGKMTRAECEVQCDRLGSDCVAIDFGNTDCTGDKCACHTVPQCHSLRSASTYDVWMRECDRSYLSPNSCPYRVVGFDEQCSGTLTYHGMQTETNCWNKCDELGSSCAATVMAACQGALCMCFSAPKCDTVVGTSGVSGINIWKRQCSTSCPYRRVALDKGCSGTKTDQGSLTLAQCTAKCASMGAKCDAIDFGTGSECSGDSCKCYTVAECRALTTNVGYDTWQRRCDKDCAWRRVGLHRECTGSETSHGVMKRAECQKKCDALGSGCVAIDFGNSCTDPETCDCFTVSSCDGFRATSQYDIWMRQCAPCPYQRIASNKKCSGALYVNKRYLGVRSRESCQTHCDTALGSVCAVIDFEKCGATECRCFAVSKCSSFTSTSSYDVWGRQCGGYTNAGLLSASNEDTLARLSGAAKATSNVALERLLKAVAALESF